MKTSTHPLVIEFLSAHPEIDLERLVGHPALVQQLIEIAAAEHSPKDWWGIWIVDLLFRAYPESVTPFGDKIAALLSEIESDSNKRQFTKLLIYLDFDEMFHAQTIDICMSWLLDFDLAVAARVNSMRVLSKMVVLYPELYFEVREAIELASEEGSKAMTARARKELHQLEKVKKQSENSLTDA